MSYINSRELLRRAHAELDAAHLDGPPRERFLHAHMAGLRAAAAALALNPRPHSPRRKKLRSAWEQLAELGPEWGPWAEYYLGSAATRAALESGQLREIEMSQANSAVAIAGQFLEFVGVTLAKQEEAFRELAQAS